MQVGNTAIGPSPLNRRAQPLEILPWHRLDGVTRYKLHCVVDEARSKLGKLSSPCIERAGAILPPLVHTKRDRTGMWFRVTSMSIHSGQSVEERADVAVERSHASAVYIRR